MHAMVRTTRLCFRIATLCVAAWLSIAPPSAAADSQLNSRDLLALSGHDADRRAQHDLLSLFERSGRYDSGRWYRVHRHSLTTRPYGTTFQGVCRKDSLALDYAPARSVTDGDPDHERRGPSLQDVPLEPYGFDTVALFHIDRLPVGQGVERSEIPAWQSSCDPDRLDDKTSWFAAPDTQEAVLAANLFRMAEDQVRAGTLTPSCANTSCAKAVLALDDLAKLQDVKGCTVNATEPCVILHLNSDTQLVIRGRMDGGQTVTPSAVTSIEMEQYIVLD